MEPIDKKTIRAAEIRALYLAECSPVTFWRLRASDISFPKPFKLGGTNYWDREEVQVWYEKTKEQQVKKDAQSATLRSSFDGRQIGWVGR